ncbi:hypothetical protein AGMMS49983_00010 [Clostridia bacterium]|nr:hypothetical protein AGMMS49983_00010 [Clostridia bacterium]
MNIKTLQAKRSAIAKEIDGIHSMRKGTLNPFHQKVTHKNGEVVLKGSYYVLTRKEEGGKTITQSIPAKDMPRIQQEVDNYKEFRRLTEEYVRVCESISLLSEGDDTKKN